MALRPILDWPSTGPAPGRLRLAPCGRPTTHKAPAAQCSLPVRQYGHAAPAGLLLLAKNRLTPPDGRCHPNRESAAAVEAALATPHHRETRPSVWPANAAGGAGRQPANLAAAPARVARVYGGTYQNPAPGHPGRAKIDACHRWPGHPPARQAGGDPQTHRAGKARPTTLALHPPGRAADGEWPGPEWGHRPKSLSAGSQTSERAGARPGDLNAMLPPAGQWAFLPSFPLPGVPQRPVYIGQENDRPAVRDAARRHRETTPELPPVRDRPGSTVVKPSGP